MTWTGVWPPGRCACSTWTASVVATGGCVVASVAIERVRHRCCMIRRAVSKCVLEPDREEFMECTNRHLLRAWHESARAARQQSQRPHNIVTWHCEIRWVIDVYVGGVRSLEWSKSWSRAVGASRILALYLQVLWFATLYGVLRIQKTKATWAHYHKLSYPRDISKMYLL